MLTAAGEGVASWVATWVDTGGVDGRMTSQPPSPSPTTTTATMPPTNALLDPPTGASAGDMAAGAGAAVGRAGDGTGVGGGVTIAVGAGGGRATKVASSSRTGAGIGSPPAAIEIAALSAWAKASALGKRSAGRLAIARATTGSMLGGEVTAISDGRGGTVFSAL
jgi:hypothetical protein